MRRILVALFLLVVFLYFRNRSSYYCEKDQSEIIWNGKSNCFKKGDYSDTSGNFPSSKKLEIKAGPNTIQAFYKKNFGNATWKANKNSGTIVKTGWPWSLKVF
jgi:hypothetical protein